MSLRNVTIESSHGVERLFIRATIAQKHLINELRADNRKYLVKGDNSDFYELHDNVGLIRIVNTDTVEKLIDQKFLNYVSEFSNKIVLSVLAK